MHLTRHHWFLLGGFLLVVLGPLALSQPGGRRGGGKGFSFDPDSFFDKIAKGKDVIVVAEVESTNPRKSTADMRESMNTFLQKKGVTNGQMTKELYREYFQERMQQWGRGKGSRGSDGSSDKSPADLEAQAKESFKKFDTDGNGSLSEEEMQAAGKQGSKIWDDRKKYDKNNNGTIEEAEYVEYYKDRMSRNRRDQGEKDKDAATEEDKPPVVYRVGNLPKGLPAWFEQYDRDKDGQVGLYEWKANGRSTDEFLAMDANGDGFVTVEELLRYQKMLAKKEEKNKQGGPSAAGSPAATFAGGMPFEGGRGRGRGGRMGRGGMGGDNIEGGDNADRGGRSKGGRSKGGRRGGGG